MRDLHRWQHQCLGSTTLPHRLSELELSAFFTFSESEIAQIRSRYKPNLRIAAAIQLGFLKMTGRSLDALGVIPRELLRHIGARLELPAPKIASLRSIYRRRKTLFEHQAWAMDVAGFSRPTSKQLAHLTAHLRKEARYGISVDALVALGNVWLYQQNLINPGDRPIRDFARHALAESEQGLWTLMTTSVPETTRHDWERKLLSVRPDGRAYLEWLAEPPRRGNRSEFSERLDRIQFLKSLKVDRFPLDGVSPAKIRLYGEQMRQLRPVKFRELRDPIRTLRLVCFLRWMLMNLTDTALLMAGRQITKLWREANDKALLLEAKHTLAARDALTNIFTMVDESGFSDTQFREAVRALKGTQTKPSFPTRAAAARWLLTEPGVPIRPLLQELQKLDLRWENATPTTQSYEWLREAYTQRTTALPPGTAFRSTRGWQFILDGDDRARALRGLEAATLMNIKKSLRNGTAWIDDSLSFRNRDHLLISRSRWTKERHRRYTQLNLPLKADEFLEPLCTALEVKLNEVKGALDRGDITIEEGAIRLPRLKAEGSLAETSRRRDELFEEIGAVQLPDLILEIDSLTGFSRALLDRPARSEEELLKVYGGMLAHGASVDATAIALQIPQLTPAQVLSGMQLFEDTPRLRAANDVVTSFQRQHPVVQVWGDGKLASSDMMSMDVARQIWNARLDPKRGIPSIGSYTHVSDFWSIIYDQPIVLNERQAGAAIEGAVRQEEIELERLAVDTHGWTHFAMGLAKVLGFDLCPRLKRLSDRQLHVPRGFHVPTELLAVVALDVSTRSIKKQWDDYVRIAASVETGQTSAVIALARYGSAAANDPVYRAGVHLGRLILSLYLCDYFTNEEFRRIINRILVHGEAVHQLQRAIQMGSFSKPRGQRHEELVAMSGSLSLLTNLCLAWTTSKIQEVLDTWPRARCEGEGGQWLQAVSPAHFQNINFRGTFRFPVERYRDRVLGRERGAAMA